MHKKNVFFPKFFCNSTVNNAVILAILVVILFVFSSCSLLKISASQQYLLCSDNITQVINITDCPADMPVCPASCDDGKYCTKDKCNEATNFICVHDDIFPCSGNGICEEGEFPISDDCPKTCDDAKICTKDSYDFGMSKCIHEPIVPCCGNGVCETGETYMGCPLECESVIDIRVTKFEKRDSFEGATYGRLTDTNSNYLVLEFKIENIGVDREETINYRKEKGFYYDPFKMKVEDENGKKYEVEYDSDLLGNWLDAVVIPKGDTRGAALLFVVPRQAVHLRLVAYDRYNNKMDSAEIY